jgi:hypothetical protein
MSAEPKDLTVYEPPVTTLPDGTVWHPGQRRGTDTELSAYAWRLNDQGYGDLLRRVAADVRGVPEHQHIGAKWAGRIAGTLEMAALLVDELAGVVSTDTRACATCGHPASVHGRRCWQQTTVPPAPSDRFGRRKGDHVYGGGGQGMCACRRFLAPKSATARLKSMTTPKRRKTSRRKAE